MKNKLTIILVAVIILLLSIIIFMLVNNKKEVSALEKIKIQELTEDVIDNSYEFEHKELQMKEKQVLFALDYYINQGKKEIDFDDVKRYINNNFLDKIEISDIEKIGVNPLMLEKDIVLDYTNQKYINNRNLSQSDIAKEKIIKYYVNSVTKKKNDIYIIKYDKYVIDNPYSLYNKYNEIEKNSDNDSSEIMDYLLGKKTKNTLNKFLSEKVIKELGKKEKEITVTIQCSDDIFIKEIN